MKRTLVNTFCVLLVLASYLWGGCVACQQLLAENAAADCCKHDKCNRTAHEASQGGSHDSDSRPSAPGCSAQPWMQAPTQDYGVQMAQSYSSLPSAMLVPAVLDPLQLRRHLHHAPDPPGASPPDLPILHAALLI